MALSKASRLISFVFLCVGYVIGQDYDQYQEFAAAREGERGLFPNIFNLATHADIRATATCGQHGPEYYCKLVEHVFMRQPQCDICDAQNHYKNHPIDNAIDGTRKWWQSPSLANGLSYEKVNITLDLRQEYQVAYVIIKAGNSPRPGTWLLEKSLDGQNYSPWQYFAISDAECMKAFGVPASTGVPKFARDDEVICTSFFSRLDPLEFGEIHISLVNGRPGAEHPSEELTNFTRTRYIRLRMLSLRTLNADLMVITRRHEKLDHSVTRRYFYSVSDVSIGGQCICYGHAERCPPEETHGQFRCECRHNTCGESCNECCPLFNQLPWKPGTHAVPNICQPCQCFNHADRCEYDAEIEEKRLSMTPDGIYEGGGRCIECRDNTEGINCEKCKYGFYRPSNVSHYLANACRACDCDPIGSEHLECVRDETSALNDLRPGDCICKPGFGGRRCDKCAPGYRNHPVCDRCPCNQAGSLNFDTCEEAECICKPNVEGKFCDKCKNGTIFLNPSNPLGCQQCFCFGKTGECKEGDWDTGYITSNHGWNLTDLQGHVDVPPKSNTTELLIFNTNDYGREHSLYYWKAPPPFSGNLLNSYGGNLHYYVYFVPAHNQGYPTPIADLVIEGNGIKIEYYSRLNIFARENMSVTIPLREGDGWYNSQTRRPIEKSDLMRALADTKTFLVRARYNQEQVQASIYGLTLETAVPAKTTAEDVTTDVETTTRFPLKFLDHKMNSVEVCTCPEHFTGSSCERCVAGYRRVNEQLYDGRCEKCNCEGHSNECDPYSGACLNCNHNTTGPRCEQCLPGYYGNPSLGGELGACKQCACPTLENNHSPQCTLSQLVFEGAAAANQDEYVCTACDEGYDGAKCDICADGFFGDPLATNGTCQPCSCNGNIDPMAIGNCDRKTGQCLKCIGHTTGDACERCEDNHYGSALDHTCKPCGCHHVGAVSLQCSNDTGTCECKENYVGPKCDRCQPGHGDVEKDCPACNCNATGAIGTSCDEVSGQCSCKKGVYGKQCDLCVPSYFNFTDVGCQFCHCNEYGAVDAVDNEKKCDNVTGKCECRSNVAGTRCEQCLPGFFNITSGLGCQACECNDLGSTGTECNIATGQCVCKSGVTGLKCDKCAPNHYGMNDEGCKECQVCPAAGQVCDPINGDCVCPPNTVGDMCEKCTKNAWNYHHLKGCELCDCSGIGADSSECNPINGQCKCKSGYIGHKCDHCEAGYFNFPNCEPCNCDPAGTDPLECRDNLCLCSNEGQCKCKKHVTGEKCDQCDANSFSLEKTNPTGCTECFCFNRTNFCVPNSLVWQQSYTPDRHVVFEDPFIYFDRKEDCHILKEYPLNYNSYPTNNAPLYWPLPRSFLGDRTGSYNGFIRFRIWNDDNHNRVHQIRPDAASFRLFPQVLLIGNDRIKLEHIPNEISDDGKYKVRLHESQWRNRISPQLPVTRKQLMVALQKVQAIYVRGTYNHMYRGDSISLRDVSLDISVGNVKDGGNASTAIGVEKCADCPEGYAGDSCQNPAEGYCRKRHPDYLNNPDDIALIGFSTPCACNEHSTTCDPETCRCTDCQHNTEGDFCDKCSKGYYGNAKEGRPDSCMKCACPLASNSFSDTCTTMLSGRGYVCDACKYGYKGSYCEICDVGYYGNPNIEGGYCRQCDCHPYGSLSAYCHNVTGQCECRNGVEGRDCSACRPRHAFINRVCTSCDQGCTKELMEIEDELEAKLQSVQNITDIKPIPHKRLARILQNTESFNSILDSIQSSEIDAETLLGELSTENRYVKQANIVLQEASVLEERNNDSTKRLAALRNDVEKVQGTVIEQNSRVVDISNQLAHFSSQISHHPTNKVDDLIAEAEKLLNATRERDTDIEKRFNYAKKNAEDAEKLLKEILSKKLNDTSYDMLFETHAERHKLIKEFRDEIWDNAKSNASLAKDITAVVNKRLQTLQNTIDGIVTSHQNSKDELDKAEKVVEKIKGELLNIHDHYTEINGTLLNKARDGTKEARAVVQTYQEFLPDYHHNHVIKAENHAKELEHEARRLKNSFYETEALSKNALTASKAYTEIAEALRNASKATSKAKTDAEDAYGYADPNSDKSLVNKATSAIEKSRDLEEAAKTTNNKDNEESLNRIQTNLDNVKLVEADIEKNISWIKDVHLLLDDHHDRINTVHNTVVQAQTTLADVQKRAENFAKDVEDLQKRAEAVGNFNEQTIRDEIENVTKSAAQISDSLKQLDDVRNRAEKHDEDMTEIRKDLSVLKEKIKEAREMAAKVKIAVKSEAKDRCVREYISPAHPSPSNTISLKYQPALDVPDSLLFLTMIEKTRGTLAREFIAIELKERRIIVHWNIGSGNRKATNSHNIGHIAASNRYTWYHIDVKRNGNSMKISVAQKDTRSGESAKNMDRPTEITVGEPDATNDVILNTEPGKTRISIGHSSPTLASELGLATHQFNGVLNELTVDGQNVPLWVFASQNGNCDGSAGGPKPFVRGHMFRDGFAQILMPMTERRDTSISIDFSAYSPNGLLYFRGSQETHDFIAIQLHNGGVELIANFGQDSKVVASSTKTSYADGRDHKITTHRRNNTIHLRVDSEDDHVSVAVPNDSTLDINYDVTHFVGGVPPDFDKAPFSDSEIQWNGFFGCVQSVKLNQNPELDLDNPMRSQRKEPGCESRNNRLMPTDRVIGFSKAGYLISSGIELSSDSSVSFNFRTRNSNAVLMYQSGRFRRRERRQDEETDKTFFAFYLFNGRLIVHLGTDSLDRTKRPSLTSTNSYNDGRIHSVFIARVGPKIEVRVDDREVLRTEFSDLTTIGSSGAQLFLGGFPEKIIPKNKNQDMGTSEPLIGCLSDFYYNYEKMPVIPESHQATLGYCAYDDELAPESDEPTTGDEQKASERKNSKLSLQLAAPTLSGPDHYESLAVGHLLAMTQDTCSNIQDTTKSPSVSGVRYGVSSSSHSRINFRNDTRSYPDPENFKLTFSFRTVKKNGMLWVWANYKFYTRYFYLNMEGGFLSLEAKGHKQPKIQRYNAKRLNDNEWHRVDLRKQGREVRLQVDNLPPQLMKDMPSPKVMKRRMYVGGVISRHKKNFTLPFDGFVGCIRNFEVDDQVCDLVEASRDVIPCADTQGVAYVHSGGYASFGALREFGLNPTGTDFNIRFRSSQPNGLILSLLSNANHTTARLTTHIENRGVVFNALLVKYGVDISQRIDFTICDNQWHEFSVLLGTTHFILRLDDIRREIPVQIPSEAIEVFRSLPVHVGGVSPHVASIHKLNSTEGCFKDLQLSGVFVPFEKAKRTNKVVPDGCPYI